MSISRQDVVIRPARPEDGDDLQRNCFSAMTVPEVVEWIRGLDESSVMLVADLDGTVLATVTLTRPEHSLRRHRAEVAGFVIAGRAQGTGLARLLNQACLDQASSWGCPILEISCRGGTHAEDAYRGLGYREFSRLPAGLPTVTRSGTRSDSGCLSAQTSRDHAEAGDAGRPCRLRQIHSGGGLTDRLTSAGVARDA